VAVNLAAVEVVVVVVVVAVKVEEVARQVWLPWQVVDKRLLDKPLADKLAVESGQPVPGGVA
jgi:hypothetical protein